MREEERTNVKEGKEEKGEIGYEGRMGGRKSERIREKGRWKEERTYMKEEKREERKRNVKKGKEERREGEHEGIKGRMK